jgi:DNA polymerase I
MAKPPWLVIDCGYVCWRAYHSTGHLGYQGVGTGVLFGFFKTVNGLKQSLGTSKVVFAFDLPPYKRREVYPDYKANRRRDGDPVKEEERDEVRRQIDLLRTDYLERIGYRNVLFQRGYEADDIIASVCKGLDDGERAVVVSGDQDLYQLLSKQVRIWNPTTGGGKVNMRTRKWFKKEYGIPPRLWPSVKAIAGCKGDNVVGVDRVGEVIATAFLLGRKVNRPSFEAIEKFVQSDAYVLNKSLVRLPYTGCKKFRLFKDEFDRDAHDNLMNSLGMHTLRIKEL